MYVYRCRACPQDRAQVALRDAGAAPECMAHGHPVVMELVLDEPVCLPIDGLSSLRQHALEGGVARAALSPFHVSHLKANGILMPETQGALEWLYRHRATNGMAGAFLMVGGRRCIDLVAFARLARASG